MEVHIHIIVLMLALPLYCWLLTKIVSHAWYSTKMIYQRDFIDELTKEGEV
jgi:cytochrome b561